MADAHLVLLGTGNAESLRYWNTNALVRTGEANILIDCGFTIKYALAEVGLTLREIDAVFVTHAHGDHVHGLERLGFESRYVYQRRPTLYLETDLYSVVWDRCLSGSMGHTSCGANRLEDFFDVHLIKNHTFTAGGCRFHTFPTPHTIGKPSYGVVLNERVLFTSDTNLIPHLDTFFPAGTIIHDCCLQTQNPVHATLHELIFGYLGTLRRRVFLSHYGDGIDFYRTLIEREFAGVAAQGQVIEL
ncbi:Lactamase_B domain-containing protein [Gammaproteobacteria bacterium]